MPSQASWVLDTLILTVAVKKADGTEEARDIVLKAAPLGGTDFSQVRLIPMWTSTMAEDTIATDPATGEKRHIKAGSPISYEDTPLTVDTVKPHELVEHERSAR